MSDSKGRSDQFHSWRPHPWHGLQPGLNPPLEVRAYIEITPFDLVKYEVDKESGYTIVDRPQRTSAAPPALYGFIPQTYCDERVRKLTPGAKRADGDPLDICVISERQIERGDILLNARVIGGIQMIDGGEADDKIIGVLRNDYIWSEVQDIKDLPDVLIQRLQHYFSTYKMGRNMTSGVEITATYGREHAGRVVSAAIEDYQDVFGQSQRAWERLEEQMLGEGAGEGAKGG
jgi:inorganic pyrophosphatase